MKRLICFLALVSLLVFPVHADGAVEIRTPDDLAAMAQNPSGSYILMEDLDMSGIAWKSIDFSGKFDGNGKSILNLSIQEPGDKVWNSYDGNSILYETKYFGLFGTLENAEVKNLNLVNVRTVVSCDEPCYLGAVAGGMRSSSVTDCTVTGSLELRAHDRSFGIGGILGFAPSGTLERCTANVTLISVDTDAVNKDEQFMGGLLANGFLNAYNNKATIDGYISEHGYVHSGGLIGMYMREPDSGWDFGEVKENEASGKITFYEDNPDRRAYCKGDIGEVLGMNYRLISNLAPTFLRDEKWDADKTSEMRPEMCATPKLTENVVAATCQSFGYTETTCQTCGRVERDHYTLKQHSYSDWTVEQEPTEEAEGVQVAVCTACGTEVRESIPKLEPAPTEPETEAPAPTEPVAMEKPKSNSAGLLYISIGSFSAAAVLIVLAIIFSITGKTDEPEAPVQEKRKEAPRKKPQPAEPEKKRAQEPEDPFPFLDDVLTEDDQLFSRPGKQKPEPTVDTFDDPDELQDLKKLLGMTPSEEDLNFDDLDLDNL